jgi:adenosine deaminase
MISAADLARAMPKVELHCHLEGTMRPETLSDLAKKNKVDLGVASAEDLYAFKDFDEFFRLFRAVQSVLKTRDDWARVAYESVLDAARANIVYREAFVSPAYFLAKGQEIRDILAGLSDGLAAGEKDTNARTMLIGGIDRAFGPSAGIELAQTLVQLRTSNASGAERLIGLGMDGVELGTKPADYHEAFRLAAAAGLHCTSHQGAEGPASNITDALDILGCERIDHGLAALDDHALAHRACDERIPFNVCPSSNLSVGRYKSLSEHPFHSMRKAGLLATLGSDDPAFTKIDLADEYGIVAEAYGMSWQEILQTALDAVEATWLSDSEKKDLGGRIMKFASCVEPVFSHADGQCRHA